MEQALEVTMDDVIDFRFRPVGAQSWTRDTTFHYLDRMGLNPTPSFLAQSTDLMFEEMKQAGISIGVIGVPGPTAIRGLNPIGAAGAQDAIAIHPEMFVSFGSVEPSDIDTAVKEIRDLGDAGVIGVTIDPSTAQVSRRFDDLSLYPLYEQAQKSKMLITTTQSCLLGPYLDDCRPEYVDHVATDFPHLTIVIQHGSWPYVHEAIGLLYKQQNVFLVPGQYAHYNFPGSNEYIHALTHQCQDQIIFGSVYPNCGLLTDLRDTIRSWKLPPSVERKYLHDNAARILSF
jgi:predicted TIM-barrel fold metal-dependent hydrolase